MKASRTPTNRLKVLSIYVPMTAILAGTTSAAITVINGGFEDTTGMTPVGNFYQGSVPGWTFSGTINEIATTAAFGTPTGVSGNSYLEAFDTGPNGLGILSQTVSGMTIGQNYELTFDWGNRTEPALGDDYEFDVSIAGQNFSQYGVGAVNMTSATIPFTASSTSETIDITFHPTSNLSQTNGAFDNFAINQVPEPSSTLLIGIGGMCMILRRHKVVT